MKKRFLLPLLAIGAPIAIGVADAAIHMTGCQFGHQGACAELAKRQESSSQDSADRKQAAYEQGMERNKRHLEFMQAEAVRKAKPAYRIKAAGGQQSMVRGCEAIIKPSLKDPNSYRYLSGRVTIPTAKSMNVIVNYTATNGFGGRVQSNYTCEFNG